MIMLNDEDNKRLANMCARLGARVASPATRTAHVDGTVHVDDGMRRWPTSVSALAVAVADSGEFIDESIWRPFSMDDEYVMRMRTYDHSKVVAGWGLEAEPACKLLAEGAMIFAYCGIDVWALLVKE